MIGSHEVIIVGGGAGGQAVASSLLKRNPKLDIAIIEPEAKQAVLPWVYWNLILKGREWLASPIKRNG
ncbi:MAG: sulfide:quinone oxidoreductase [Oceanospirillaceae bacterium]|jgi:sulfide:quinone oxidoreductase